MNDAVIMSPDSSQNTDDSGKLSRLDGKRLTKTENISQIIKDAMNRKQMNQSEMAHWAGVPESTLSRVESGVTKKPSQEFLKKIAPCVGVSWNRLLKSSGYSVGTAEEEYYNFQGEKIPCMDIVADIYRADCELLETLSDIQKLDVKTLSLLKKLIQIMKEMSSETDSPLQNSSVTKELYCAVCSFLETQLSCLYTLRTAQSEQ